MIGCLQRAWLFRDPVPDHPDNEVGRIFGTRLTQPDFNKVSEFLLDVTNASSRGRGKWSVRVSKFPSQTQVLRLQDNIYWLRPSLPKQYASEFSNGQYSCMTVCNEQTLLYHTLVVSLKFEQQELGGDILCSLCKHTVSPGAGRTEWNLLVDSIPPGYRTLPWALRECLALRLGIAGQRTLFKANDPRLSLRNLVDVVGSGEENPITID